MLDMERQSGQFRAAYMKTLAIHLAVVLSILAASSHAQRFADFPFGMSSSPSPGGRFSIEAGACSPANLDQCDRRLWLVDHRTNRRELLIEFPRTVRIGWAPTDNAFYLNDDEGSNISEAYLYDPLKSARRDLGDLIDAKFPADKRFEEASHHYFNGVRWLSPNALIVKRFGHFDHPVGGGNEFTVCYLVRISGTVRRLKETRHEDDRCDVPVTKEPGH
jgi:hypothetical protein